MMWYGLCVSMYLCVLGLDLIGLVWFGLYGLVLMVVWDDSSALDQQVWPSSNSRDAAGQGG
jgi:hypothetical protein